MSTRVQFYHATRFIFPRSYQLRMFTVCFGAVHLPLIAFCLAQLLAQSWDWYVFGILLVATLVGSAGAIAALSALLAPISQATDLLRAVQRGERVQTVPVGGDDLVGQLLNGISLAASETADRMDRLSDAADTDLLTGMRNRRGFLDAVAPLLRREYGSVIAMIDLDHFKQVNDHHGHEEGDRVLQAFGKRLEKSLRRSDLAARWGGEEFTILFPDTVLGEARQIVDHLRISLQADAIGSMPDGHVTFSCGLAMVGNYSSLDAAMRKADTALYQAKQAGRNQITSLA